MAEGDSLEELILVDEQTGKEIFIESYEAASNEAQYSGRNWYALGQRVYSL